MRFFTIFSFRARALQFVTYFTIGLHNDAGCFLYNSPMHTKAGLRPATPAAYDALLPLIALEPWAAVARAAIFARLPDVWVNDGDVPSVVALEVAAPEGRACYLFGAAGHPALAALVQTLTGPLTLHAEAPIAELIPSWRTDAVARSFTTLTLPAGDTDAAFAISPPGGVRRLRAADARHLTTFPPWLWAGYGSPEAMLRHGIAYARYLRAELVAVASTAGVTERHDAIAVSTIERTRRNGFARECAQRLIGAIRSERGTLPVLTTSADNDAALALAHSLGLTARHDHTAYDLA